MKSLQAHGYTIEVMRNPFIVTSENGCRYEGGVPNWVVALHKNGRFRMCSLWMYKTGAVSEARFLAKRPAKAELTAAWVTSMKMRLEYKNKKGNI